MILIWIWECKLTSRVFPLLAFPFLIIHKINQLDKWFAAAQCIHRPTLSHPVIPVIPVIPVPRNDRKEMCGNSGFKSELLRLHRLYSTVWPAGAAELVRKRKEGFSVNMGEDFIISKFTPLQNGYSVSVGLNHQCIYKKKSANQKALISVFSSLVSFRVLIALELWVWLKCSSG